MKLNNKINFRPILFNYNSKQIKSLLLLFRSLRWSKFRVLIFRGPLAIAEIHGPFQNTYS